MGLDITAYSKLQKLDVLFDAAGEPADPQTREPLDYAYTKVHVNHDFPGRAEPLEDKACYSYENSMGFRAGSYGGYNGWREQLATLAEYPAVSYAPYHPDHATMRRDAAAWQGKADGMPFVELVNFSDCEGVIGSLVAAKLAKDFAEWDERAKAIGGGFYDRYTHWRQAFEMAADGGCVDFH
jgi:hypothetical protein